MTPRYRIAPSMSLRPADTVEPRSQMGDTPAELGVMGCAPIVSALLLFAALVAMVFVAMWVLA